MKVISDDKKRVVNIGNSEYWHAVFSTIYGCIGQNMKKYPFASFFLETGICNYENGYRTARDINHIRDSLAKFKPEEAVYDINDRKKKAPWEGKISEVITSCANYYTTADGGDLLYELVCIFCYAQIAKVSVRMEV
ncbi:MAG: Imm70 family immunity protein [Eubacteriales bacterium]|nr:Imm70 family immunity protein [Eubacteriales bacterium]